MKIPNILRRYGGADIKLKVNIKIVRLFVTVLLLIGGFILCRGIYLLFDQVMNGFVVDWFEENYILQEWRPIGNEGQGYFYRSVRWGKLKVLLFQSFIAVVFLWIMTVRLASILYAGRQEKKVLCAAGKMINDYMRHDREASDVFPNEYAQIAAQMSEIKASMQRHEQVLKEETSRKNDLITYLAHDLKTPLTSIVGYLSLLEETPKLPAQQREKYVHITLEKALHLEKLINEFFEITRYNLQQIVLEKETVDLVFLLVQMADEFYPVLSAHGNTIKLRIGQDVAGEDVVSEECRSVAVWGSLADQKEEGLIYNALGQKAKDGSQERGAERINVYADGEKLARVFCNILKNAIAYSYPDTEIGVDCLVEGEKVRIVFANRGRTIPQQKLNAIFEKFFRLDDARNTNTGRAGLGLSIAREIVTLHGGTISAESQDEVTRFIVMLPY